MRPSRIVFAGLSLALAQCTSSAEPEAAPPSVPAPSLAGSAPVKTPHGSTLLPVARIEGYGNPATGELWIRAIAVDADGRERDDGVQGTAQALSARGGFCELTVDNTSDPVKGTNPVNTFEFYTRDPNAMVTSGDPTDDSSFVPSTCQGHLSPALMSDTFYSSVLFTTTGVGCASQHVGNFYNRRFEHVFMDVDVWNGNFTTNGPYGPGFTDGTVATRPGRRGPSDALGLWDFGPLAAAGQPGDEIDAWIFFKNAPGGGAFNFSGHLVGEVIEDCSTGMDDDCDGVVNNNCATKLPGEACFHDQDCGEGLACRGAIIRSHYGAANAGSDSAGSCQKAPSAVAHLASGPQSACAIVPAGTSGAGGVRCWGNSPLGATGNPTNQPTASSAPLLMLGSSRALSLAASLGHTCAVFEDGSVRCWGDNSSGQTRGAAGSTVFANASAPAALGVGAPAVQVAAGGSHTCVLRDDGGVRCFGANDSGQCGAKLSNSSLSLHGTQDVVLGGPAAQICAGTDHNCALLDDRSVRCWGSGVAGRLGYGNTNDVGDDESPAEAGAVSVLSSSDLAAGRYVKTIACGGAQSCAILDNGALRCWGEGTALGYGTPGTNIGDTELPSSVSFVNVGANTVTQVSIGFSSTCARLTSGAVTCWGSTLAPNGCLGYASGCATNLSTPPVTPVNLGSGLTAVELSQRSDGATPCAVLSDGGVKCWGANGLAQAGYGDTMTPISPPRLAYTLGTPASTILGACTTDTDCSLTALCHEGMCVRRGPLRATVTWSGNLDDLDLYVLTPGAQQVFYGNPSAGGGILDDDECSPSCTFPAGTHVESIAFPSLPATGHYEVWVRNGGASTSPYKLEVFYDDVVVLQELGTLANAAETTHLELEYPVICGDGHVTLGEACDPADGYGCSPSCTVMPGFQCTGVHSVCTCLAGTGDGNMDELCVPLGCGDGLVTPSETCEDGNTVTEHCAYGATMCMVCNSSCQEVAGDTDFCNDGTVDTANGESCEDGNTITEDCAYGEPSCVVCNATCHNAQGATHACGDNTVDAADGEECDDGNTNGGDTCSADCTYNECIGENGGHDCDGNATCTDAHPGFDCTCNEGYTGGGHIGGCTPIPATRVFLTNQVFSGALGGALGADAVCQEAADSASLGGAWMAWVSDSNVSVADRFAHSKSPYKLLTGTIIAANWDSLTSTNLQAPINVDEEMNLDGSVSIGVWTGTDASGQADSNDCNDWTDANLASGLIGNGASSGTNWSASELRQCGGSNQLYCFEQPNGGASELGVFVTSTPLVASYFMGSVLAADAFCQVTAKGQSLDGTWRAWMSSSASAVAERFTHYEAPYRAVGGDVIAYGWTDLTTNPLQAPIDRDEFGNPVSPATPWTGTSVAGAFIDTYACNDWASASDTDNAAVGATDDIAAWSAFAPVDCTGTNPIFCFQQEVVPITAKRVFVTSAAYQGSALGGVAGADDLCQSHADIERLGGAWKAWLSDSAGNLYPGDRFSWHGPYTLLDGTPVADSWLELTSSSIQHPIDLDETLTQVGVTSVWTGTGDSGLPTGNDCSGWTASGSGDSGSTDSRDSSWYFSATSACTGYRALYCFEQVPTVAPPILD